MLEMVKENWEIIEYIGENLQNDEEIVKIAVSSNWKSIIYDGPIPKTNQEIIDIVIRQNPKAIPPIIGDTLTLFSEINGQHRMLIDEIPKYCDLMLELSPPFQDNEDLVLYIIQYFPSAIQYASERLKLKYQLSS